MSLRNAVPLLLICVSAAVSARADPPGAEAATPVRERPLKDRLLPATKNGGFQMPGYFVWCGAIIAADGKYHMFASRWPKATGFPEGYRKHSEIVRAEADRPEGPYRFAEVALARGAADAWDSGATHNSKILRLGEQFVLFYIGNHADGQIGQRAVGYATAPNITGPWKRGGAPIPNLVKSKECPRCDATNPAPCVRPDGGLLMAFRQSPEMLIAVAIAPRLEGPWTVENRDVWRNLPEKPDWQRYEDPDVAFFDGRYQMVVEDNNIKRPTVEFGAGIHFQSDDGLRWKLADPPCCYTKTIAWDDSTSTKVYRRERPQFFVENGTLTHIVTAVKEVNDQSESRIVIQRVEEERSPIIDARAGWGSSDHAKHK